MKLIRQIREPWLLLACLFGCLINYIAYKPGFLSPDSIDQFNQSLKGRYEDWHPPAMALLWHWFDKIHKGPQPMLLFQLVCLWGSAYLLAAAVRDRIWRIIVFCMVLMPFVQNFAGYVIKDSQMALSWLAAFALMFNALVHQRKTSAVESIAALLLLIYGEWVRPNALPGCLTLCYLWAAVNFTRLSAVKNVLVSVCMLIVIHAGEKVVIETVLQPKKQYAQTKLYLHDLTGIFVKTGENVFPSVLYRYPLFDTGFLRAKYHPASFDPVWWNKENIKVIPTPDSTLASELFAAWKDEVGKHPDIYLRNRFEGFLYYLRFRVRNGVPFTSYIAWISDNPFGLQFHRNVLSDVFIKPLELQQNMPYMKPWFWFFFNVLLLAFIPFIRQRPLRLAFATLVLSGFLYQAPSFFIFQVDTDFRYFYWNCICCTLALALLVLDRRLVQRNELLTPPQPQQTP